MPLIHEVATVVAPWAHFYNDSAVTESAVTFGHLGGMMAAGGFALSADRAMLRARRRELRERRRLLRELRATHPIVLAALSVTAVTGLLMLAADVETLAVSMVFWLKMILVALLLANGGIMLLAERRLEAADGTDTREWARLRISAIASLALWFAVALAGSILPNLS
jgi:uncharacterized membrane protein